MPRRKAEDGSVPTVPPTRPEGLSDWEWTTGRSLGNVSLAIALSEVASGERPARDAREAQQLLEAATKLQTRALNRYGRLRSTIGQKLQAGLVDYRTMQALTDGMLRVQDDLGALVKDSENGHES